MTKVKICGVTTMPVMEAAIASGAEIIGLVLFPPSPRNLSIPQAADLAAAARGRAHRVALAVDPDDALVDAIITEIAPDYLQLHGKESPERVRAIKSRHHNAIIKAISVAGPDDASRAAAYDGLADLILFDAKPPKDGPLPGGNGIPFDWHHLDAVRHRHPFALSGGLTPQNVAEAIRLTGADIVDVSSGVESAPGRKDIKLIADFIAAAHAARP